MGLYHGRSQFLLLGTPANSSANLNLSGDLVETNLPLDLDLHDVTTGGSTGHRWYPGLMKASGSFKFVANTAANTSWNTLSNYALIQQATPANYWSANFGPGGNATSAPKVTFNFLIKSITLPVKVADVVSMTVSWEADNGFTVGTM